MKRPATQSGMDLFSPTSKKLCLENHQSDSPDPTNPIDDLDDADDLYGDSPVVISQREQGPAKSATQISQAPQPLSLQYQHIQLPGLGLYQSTLSGPEQSSIIESRATRFYSPQLDHLNDESQKVESLARLSHPRQIEMSGKFDTAGNIKAKRSHYEDEAIINPSTSVEACGSLGENRPSVSSLRPGYSQPEAMTKPLGSIQYSSDKSDEHSNSNDDGQPLRVNDSAESHHGASGVDVVDLNGSTSTNSDLQKRVLATTSTSKDPKPSKPESSQQDLDRPKNTEQQIDGIQQTVQELDQLKSFKDPEVTAGPKQRPSEPTEETKPENGTVITSSLGQEQPLDNLLRPSGSPTSTEQSPNKNEDGASVPIQSEQSKEILHVVPEMIQRLPSSPKTAGRSINGAEDKEVESHSDQSKASHFPVPEGAQTSRDMVEAEESAEAKVDGEGKENDEAEFEIDSSPIESSTDSDSDSSSSSSADSDYKMLDPEEEARRLMQEDGGSEDEGKGSKGASGPLRTLNEKPDEIVPKPQIEVTPAMAIAELGVVEHVVENSIVIKAKVSGERQALENGSLLCLEDRSVIGLIAETLGQVRQPYYAVRFTNAAAIAEAGLSKGTLVFYVEQHAKYIFTQNLKAFKGSDASNIHDEEVGDDELEFSDDEAEAEHKRRIKQARQSKRGGRADRGDGFARGPGGSRVRRGGRSNQADDRVFEPLPERPPISYDEQNDVDDLYTPLSRPTNLHEAMGHREAPQEQPIYRPNIAANGQEPRRGRPDRGRGRGDRGRGGRGGRGDRRGGGDFNRDHRNGDYSYQHQKHQTFAPPSSQPIGQEPNLLPQYNTYHASPSQGWSNASPPGQYNPPSYNASYHQSTPSFQQPPYANYNVGQYSQPPIPQSYTHPNTFPYQQNSPITPNRQYPQHQAASPTSPVPPNLPPGAHINPAFFSPNSQQPPTPQTWQQQQAQQQNTHGSAPLIGRGRSPQSEAAFLAAQEKLNLLRQLSRGGGSPT